MGPDINTIEALPELPPADFDFLIYSLRLQTELSLGLLLLGPPGQGETGQGETGQGETGQGETGQGETGQGETGDDETGDDETGPDFDLARHNIDLLAMLQQKTKGNLTNKEQQALDNSVTRLRFHLTQLKQEALNPA